MLSSAINKRLIRLCLVQPQPLFLVPQLRFFAAAPNLPKASPAPQKSAASPKS